MPTSKKNSKFFANQFEAPQLPMQFLVLWKIFSFMGLEDLKNCRLVCKTWNEVAAMIIPQLSEVRLHCHRKTKTLKADSKPISQFCKYLKTSRKLPSSPFRVININIARFGSELQNCSCRSSKASLVADSCSTCYVLCHCGSTVKTATFESVPSSSFDAAMNKIFFYFPNLDTLEITYISDYHDVVREKSMPNESQQLSPILSLKNFLLERLVEVDDEDVVGRIFDWTTFWKMFPQLSDVQLKDSFSTLCVILKAAVDIDMQPAIRKLNITALDNYNETPQAGRRLFAELLRNITSRLYLEELILDVNLNLWDWSVALEQLPPTLRRLSISSNWCMGTDYRENRFNHLTSQDSTNIFLGILKATTSGLKELAIYFQGARGVDKTIRLKPSSLKFEFIQDLSWIFIRKYSTSWETLIPGGFKELATVFPNLRRLEATVGTKTAFQQLCTALPELEELIISFYSRIKFSDQDIVGDALVCRDKPRKLAKNPGINAFKKLRSLTIESDCTNLTDESVFNGFLQMPNLVVLELTDAPEFGIAAMQALIQRNFLRLTIHQVAY